ncbi:MAG: sialidase family protein [Candidatus Latescibacteria bacterium]|nr:sialidase family protein [Candidatus Latescibacterota bacterium]
MTHVEICREPGRYGGWPANNGIWSWGDEIVVGFTYGYMVADPLNWKGHPIDPEQKSATTHARSTDGGLTWQLETPSLPAKPDGDGVPTKPADFTHPDFALKILSRGGVDAGASSRYYVSYDRCHTWDGPYLIPMMDQLGITSRTDYQVLDTDSAILFLTCCKSDGLEGRSSCCRTDDGGVSWRFLSHIGPEPKRWSIMPASVLLGGNRILVALRQRAKWESFPDFIDCYISDDMGESWEYLSTPAPDVGHGNPPAMIRLQDGRICITYGYRDEPYGMRARVSDTEGQTWGEEIILRDDGGGVDLGYPRAVQRADGKVVTAYYFHDALEGERYIGETIFEP